MSATSPGTATSRRNIKYMHAIAQARPYRPIVQEAVAQLPWSHKPARLGRLTEHFDPVRRLRVKRQTNTRSVSGLRCRTFGDGRIAQSLDGLPAPAHVDWW